MCFDFAKLDDRKEDQATELMINEELPTCRDRRRNALISFTHRIRLTEDHAVTLQYHLTHIQ
jgi:hypothetical protein